jgi:hypothetical protein
MRFARWSFLAAGIYGVLILLPGFFLESQIADDSPPAITHPEFYYGFYGCALAWQFGFLLIAWNPKRFRPLMLVGALEKLSFFVACVALYLTGRLSVGGPLIGSMVDGALMVLFIVAWLRTGTA